MPVKSPAQFRLMEAAKNGGLGMAGPSPSVAKDFLNATPKAVKSSFASRPQKFSAAMRKKPRPHVSI